jgi:SMC interacting uncharacterized protein involved in chromosome segregation
VFVELVEKMFNEKLKALVQSALQLEQSDVSEIRKVYAKPGSRPSQTWHIHVEELDRILKAIESMTTKLKEPSSNVKNLEAQVNDWMDDVSGASEDHKSAAYNLCFRHLRRQPRGKNSKTWVVVETLVETRLRPLFERIKQGKQPEHGLHDTDASRILTEAAWFSSTLKDVCSSTFFRLL